MSEMPPIQGRSVSDEQKQLVTLFQELEKSQLEFLDAAGKRIIEMTTALLGLFFALITIGDDFPPTYLQAQPARQFFTVVTLLLYLVAMMFGLLTVQPRSYKRYRHNLTGMREEFEKMLTHKASMARYAGLAFFAASTFLAVLIGLMLFPQ